MAAGSRSLLGVHSFTSAAVSCDRPATFGQHITLEAHDEVAQSRCRLRGRIRLFCCECCWCASWHSRPIGTSSRFCRDGTPLHLALTAVRRSIRLRTPPHPRTTEFSASSIRARRVAVSHAGLLTRFNETGPHANCHVGFVQSRTHAGGEREVQQPTAAWDAAAIVAD